MHNDELLKMLINLKEEFHFLSIKFEQLKDDTMAVSENSSSAHRRIDEIQERLDQIQLYY